MDDEPAGDEGPLRYVIEVVDGFGRKPLVGVRAAAVAAILPEVLAEVGRVARHLRGRDAVGRLELVDRATGAILVRRRVWP